MERVKDRIGDPESDLVDIHKAARMLHIKPGTLRQWTCKGKFPRYRIGNRTYYARADIHEYLESCRVEVTR